MKRVIGQEIPLWINVERELTALITFLSMRL